MVVMTLEVKYFRFLFLGLATIYSHFGNLKNDSILLSTFTTGHSNFCSSSALANLYTILLKADHTVLTIIPVGPIK